MGSFHTQRTSLWDNLMAINVQVLCTFSLLGICRRCHEQFVLANSISRRYRPGMKIFRPAVTMITNLNPKRSISTKVCVATKIAESKTGRFDLIFSNHHRQSSISLSNPIPYQVHCIDIYLANNSLHIHLFSSKGLVVAINRYYERITDVEFPRTHLEYVDQMSLRMFMRLKNLSIERIACMHACFV